MGNILSFLFPKPAPAALEAQELGQAPAAPAKEAVEEHPPTAPARSKKTVEAPTAQKIEEAPAVENIGSIDDTSVAESAKEPTPEPTTVIPPPVEELVPEPQTIPVGGCIDLRDIQAPPTIEAPIQETISLPVKDTILEPVKEPILEPVRLPTPEPIREPTPEPKREPTPEPVKEVPTSFCGVKDVETPSIASMKEPTPEPVEEPVKVLTPEDIALLNRTQTPEPIREPTPEPVLEVPTSFCGVKDIETPSIAEIVAETVVSTAAVTEEIIDDDKPASIDGAADLRDFLEKKKAEEMVATPDPIKEHCPEPGSIASVISETVEKIAIVPDEVIGDVKESVSKSPESPSGIANIVAETVEKIASVSEEVIDDDKPATVDGAAELRDFLEKPKESSPEPETKPSIASVIAETVGKASTLTEEILDEDEADEEPVKSSVSEAIVDTVEDLASVAVPEVQDIIKPTTPEINSTKTQEEVEVIGSIQEDETLEDNLKKSEVKGAALLRDILDD